MIRSVPVLECLNNDALQSLLLCMVFRSGFVSLSIYNMLGEEIKQLVAKNFQIGWHRIIWNAEGFNSGVYFYKLRVGNSEEIKKLLLLK